MLKKIKHFVLLCSAAFLPLVSFGHEASAVELTAEQERICNPKSMEDDLIIAGPNGSCFAFRPIKVEGEDPSKGMSFYMGDAESESFRTQRTLAMVGGIFPDSQDENIWMFYMGKYEVTQGQYYAVMNAMPKAHKEQKPKPEELNLPVTNLTYFEAVQFMDTLNQWIFANVLDEMPMSGPYPGFMRLPSEIEWEFVARGGMAVEQSLFESPNPYDDEFGKHEWFSGPKSSHGKIKAVGLLNPNPLGLHDMLGNVQEMTYSPYMIRYYEGGSGGFVSRGGSFLTQEDNLGSAQRQEEPYYILKSKKPVPNAKLTLGIRLTLAAPLLTDRNAIAVFQDNFEDRLDALDAVVTADSSNTSANARQSRATPTATPSEVASATASKEVTEVASATANGEVTSTAGSGNTSSTVARNNPVASMTPAERALAPTSNQEELSVNEALKRLELIANTPQDQLAKTLNRELGSIRATLQDSVRRRQEADAISALSTVRQGHFFGQEIYKALFSYGKIATIVKQKEGKEDYAIWKNRLDDLEFNLTSFFERYRDSIVALNNLPPETVKKAFESREREDERKLEQKAISQELAGHSLQILNVVDTHYEHFRKVKRADIKSWREQYTNLLKTME